MSPPDTDVLFDADAYNVGTPKRPRKKRVQAAPEVIPIVVDVNRRWIVVVNGRAGVHYRLSDEPPWLGALTSCRQIGAPMTFAAGEVVMGCYACINAGAPAIRAGG